MPWLPRERGLALLGRHLPRAFVRKVVTLNVGRHPYRGGDWQGALVWIERGVLELEVAGQAPRRFGPGELLALVDIADLQLSAIYNPGPTSTVLVAVWRRPPT